MAIFLYCFHTAGVYFIYAITFWALEYHFIENLKLLLKEIQIMKQAGFIIADQWSFHIDYAFHSTNDDFPL